MTKEAEIIVACVSAISIAWLTIKWKKVGIVSKVALLSTILTACLLAYNSWTENKKSRLQEKINAKFGEIEDLKGATIPELRLADSETTYVLPKGVFLYDQTGPLIKLFIKNGNLCVYTVIRSQFGEPIAVIDENTWTLYSDEFEYNNDKTAFELVTKGDRKVYFRIELVDGKAAISGVLFSESGWGINFLGKSKYSPPSDGGRLIILKPGYTGPILTETVPRIFKYPREKSPGERIN